MAYNGHGASVPGEVVITVPQHNVPYSLMQDPNFRDGGRWAREATDLDTFYYNFYNLIEGNFGYGLTLTGDAERGKNSNYAFTVSGLGNDGDLTVNIVVQHVNSQYIIKISRVSGNERAFRNLCGGLRRFLLDERYNNIPENPNNNNYEPGQGGYRRRRKTRRHRSRKTKSRRSRK
jgi:hypothetical protein